MTPLKQQIEALKKPILDKIDSEDDKYWKRNRNNDIGYNQAIKDVLELLTKEN
jgi:hypothetical protein